MQWTEQGAIAAELISVPIPHTGSQHGRAHAGQARQVGRPGAGDVLVRALDMRGNRQQRRVRVREHHACTGRVGAGRHRQHARVLQYREPE